MTEPPKGREGKKLLAKLHLRRILNLLGIGILNALTAWDRDTLLCNVQTKGR